MKRTMIGLFYGAVALNATPASAAYVTGQISLSGYAQAIGSTGMGAATGIAFANASGASVSGSSGSLASYGAGSGSFASLGPCSSLTSGCGTLQNINSFVNQGALSNFLTIPSGLVFDLTNVSQINYPGPGQLSFTALGTVRLTGFDPTPGQFVFTSQGDNITSFSATVLAIRATPSVPEPATWAMMMVGFGAIGFAMRREKTKVHRRKSGSL